MDPRWPECSRWKSVAIESSQLFLIATFLQVVTSKKLLCQIASAVSWMAGLQIQRSPFLLWARLQVSQGTSLHTTSLHTWAKPTQNEATGSSSFSGIQQPIMDPCSRAVTGELGQQNQPISRDLLLVQRKTHVVFFLVSKSHRIA